MSKNIAQVYADNPIVTNQGADLMYFGRSPYGIGDDAAMQFSDFAAQFGESYTPSALTKVDDTNITLTLGGTPSTALLESVSLTLGWTGLLSPARGGTGVNNGSNTITLGGNISTSGAHTLSGAFASTFTFTNTTSVTFPTSGTLATTSQIPTGSALTKTDDINVTLALGGSPTTALVNAASITAGWTGQLSLTRGGTNNSLTASAGGIVWSDASKLNILSGTATANQILLSGNAATPAWSTTTYPSTNAINTIMYASSANVLGVITPVNSAVLISSAGGVPSMGTTLPNINIGTPTAGVLTNTTGGGGLRSFQVFTSGSGTYNTPANVTSILVEVLGAGGAGGGNLGVTAQAGGGAGGGSGGYVRHYISSSASSYSYAVGTGGTGVTGNNTGNTGGNSTFSTLTASGGVGGAGLGCSATTIISEGGSGGAASGGNLLNAVGNPGSAGISSSALGTITGSGGTSCFGGAAKSVKLTGTASSAGTSAGNYGSGGSGGGTSNSNGTSVAGGAGSNGVIIVWEFS